MIFDLRFSIYDLPRRLGLVLLTVVLATAGFLNAQQQTTLIQDISPRSAPLLIEGRAFGIKDDTQKFPYTVRYDLRLTNRSDKSIVLRVLRMEITDLAPFSSERIEGIDYFFVPQSFAPHTTEDDSQTEGPFGTPSSWHDGTPLHPRVIAAVAFIQYSDGSSWGDLETARQFLCDRQRGWERLRELGQIYRDRGADDFRTELMKKSDLGLINVVQHSYTETNDDYVALQKLEGLLSNAERHYAAMRDRKFEEAGCGEVITGKRKKP